MDAAGGEGLWNGLEVPVVRTALKGRPFQRVGDVGVRRELTRFDEANLAGRVFAEAAGDYGPRRTATYDENVEMRFQEIMPRRGRRSSVR